VFKLRFTEIFAKEKTDRAVSLETAAYPRFASIGGW
jgi:hypothetical protein